MSEPHHHSYSTPSGHRPESHHHRGSERHGRIAHGRSAHGRSEGGARSETRRADPHRRSAPSQEDARQKGPQLATLCVLSAVLGFIVEVVNETIAHQVHGRANAFFSVFSVGLVAVSIATGIRAQLFQLQRWSRRTRQRLWLGFPVAGVALIAIIPNFFEARPVPPVLMTAAAKAAPAAKVRQQPAAVSSTETDSSLVKPGWYGELKQRDLLLVVSSYNEDAEESRAFNARLFKPVSYASFSVINLGRPETVSMNKLQVELVLGSGERVKSLPVEPLLSQNASANSELMARIRLPKTIAVGEMFSDIPICLAPDFSWSNVVAVATAVGAYEIVVPGRVMTAAEKRTLLDQTVVKPATAPRAGPSAETWYKGM